MTFQKHSAAAALLTIFTLAGTAGCGGEGQPDDSAGGLQCESSTSQNRLGLVERGALTSVPATMSFRPVSLGSVATQTVELVNDGHGRLHITGLELIEEQSADTDGEREFFRGDTGWNPGPVTLEPGDTLEVSVEYRPTNPSGDRGAIVVTTECAERATYEVPIEAPALEPDLYAPRQISFGRVPVESDPNWRGSARTFQAQNVGEGPLRFDEVYVLGSDNFRVTYPQPTDEEASDGLRGDPANDTTEVPRALGPGENFPVRVWFKPDDNLPETAELVFATNDPDERLYSVELGGNVGAPCLQVSPDDEIDFSQRTIGQTWQKTVTLENCSRSSELTIRDIRLTADAGGAFAIEEGSLPGDLPDRDFVLPPGERTDLTVTFEPTAEESYTGELEILSNDGANSPVVMPVVGRGSDNICPIAVARAWVQGDNRPRSTVETAPLNTIMLDGSQSSDPDGTIVEYQWSILSTPEGSVQRFLPDSSSNNPRLFLDLGGTYEVELRVKDDDGAYNCEPAIVTIIAARSDDVHVQLVWSTPNDPDQTDTYGTDLDLHYRHANGHWNEEPWDIFWENPTADWGMHGDSSDDPRLDIDDTDGAGPENITHSRLENLTYRTGVYYRSDHGLGASYATVRVYVRGALAVESENRFLAEGDFWDVATIDWPSGAVTEVDDVYEGFPQP